MSERVEMNIRLQEAMDLRKKKPVDVSKDLDIPKSAISMYLSGKRTIKESTRLYAIAKYLDVSEAWLMGFDVPMERPLEQKINDTKVSAASRVYNDVEFLEVADFLNQMSREEFTKAKEMLFLVFKKS